MSKRLLIRLDTSNKIYPPILLEFTIPDDLAIVIQNTPISSSTFTVTDSLFLTKAAQKEELKGELNRYRIL